MRYGIISDIHGNLEALEIVLGYLAKCSINRYLCCGDLVGYGPNPNECIQRTRALKEVSLVAGNHDLASVGLKDISWFNQYARAAIVWTSNQLSNENKEFLQHLPLQLEFPGPALNRDGSGFTLVHGSPRKPIDEYLLGYRAFRENLKYLRRPLCFIGHSHVPLYFCFNEKETSGGVLGEDRQVDLGRQLLTPNSKLIINVGSVGQPRDGDSRACFAIFDEEKKTVEIKRLDYRIDLVQKRMLQANLPGYLIERLAFGQ